MPRTTESLVASLHRLQSSAARRDGASALPECCLRLRSHRRVDSDCRLACGSAQSPDELRSASQPSARITQKTNVSWTNASESYVNIATAKPVIDATNAAASKPSGLPLVRATRPSRRTIRTISQTHREEAEQAHVEEQPEPLVVEDRGVAQRIAYRRSASCPALAEERPVACRPRSSARGWRAR